MVFFTNYGNIYSLSVTDFPSSSGYGDPVQKHLKFKDGEKVISTFGCLSDLELGHSNDYRYYLADGQELVFISEQGMGFAGVIEGMADLKKNGRRIMKLKKDDAMRSVVEPDKKVTMISQGGYGLSIKQAEVLERNVPAVGIKLMSFKKGDALAGAISWRKDCDIVISIDPDREKIIRAKSVKAGKRALKGNKVSVKGKIKGIN